MLKNQNMLQVLAVRHKQDKSWIKLALMGELGTASIT